MVTGIDASGLLSFLSESDDDSTSGADSDVVLDDAEQNACSGCSDSDKSTKGTVDSLSDGNIVDVPGTSSTFDVKDGAPSMKKCTSSKKEAKEQSVNIYMDSEGEEEIEPTSKVH